MKRVEQGLLSLVQPLKTLKISEGTNNLLYLTAWVSVLPYILQDHPVSSRLLLSLPNPCQAVSLPLLVTLINTPNKHKFRVLL